MGAGTSAEIRKHLVQAWEPKRQAPASLEREVRDFLQQARPLTQVHFAPHAPDVEGQPSSSSFQRPVWLEPQQLHIALVGQEQLVEGFLASLGEVAPLLEVVAEEGGTEPEDGDGPRALEAAAQAGFRCHAFIDQDLHLLRFWTLGEEAALASGKLAIPGLCYLDLVLLLLQPKAGVNPKPKRAVQHRRRALDSELAELQAHLAALPARSKQQQQPALPAAEEPALQEELELVQVELSELANDAELKDVRARKQALIEEEDYDGAHEAKQQEKELLAALEDRKHVLEDQRRELEARLLEVRLPTKARGGGLDERVDGRASGVGERSAMEKALRQAQADKQRTTAEKDYGGAQEAKQRERHLLEELRVCGERQVAGGRRSNLEEELELVRAQKQALIEAEDYDGAHEAKEREKELMEELKACGGRQVAGVKRSDLEEELELVRAQKQALIEAEDYDGAHEATEREKELLDELKACGEQHVAGGRRSILDEELKQVQATKQALIKAEDYDGAHEAKEKEKRLLSELDALDKQQIRGWVRSTLKEELQQVRARKQAQIEAEDYNGAHESKQKEKQLLAEFEALGEQHTGKGSRSAREEELSRVRARKQALIEAEDYDGAHEAKQREKELLAELEAQSAPRTGAAWKRALEEELQEVRAKKQALIEAEDYDGALETKQREKKLLAELDALAKPPVRGGARSALEEELEQVRARKQAQIEAEDYDGAYESKQREKELFAELEALRGEQGGERTRSILEEELRQVRARKQAMIEAEDYDGAHEAKAREKELLAELDRVKVPAGKTARAALEEELERVQARKQALIEAEDYDSAHEAKQREKQLLAELEALGEEAEGGARPSWCATKTRSALELELKQLQARKQALIEAEDYDSAHEVKQREKELLAELEALGEQQAGKMVRSALEEELSRVRARKQELIEAEDYDGAHEAKEREKELLAKLEKLPWGGTSERSPLERELQLARAEKQALIEAEDYDGAHEAKQREKALLAKLGKRQPEDVDAERVLEHELQQVRAEKQALIEAEDYDGAHEAKLKEKELLARLEGLPRLPETELPRLPETEGQPVPKEEAQARATAEHPAAAARGQRARKEEAQVDAIPEDPVAEERSLLELEVKRVLTKLEELKREEALQEEPEPESGAADDRWSEEAAALVGKGSSPPVLVASCGPAPANLRSAPRQQLAELGESLGEAPRFWDALASALRLVRASRAFPQCPDQDLGGGYSLGDWVFVKDEAHALNGQMGTAIGFEDDGTWDFKITVRLVGGEVALLRQDELNPLLTEVKFDVSEMVQLQHMDMMWVRLKGLKSRADLNGCEGLATLYSLQKREEGYASIYDCPARHTVTLEDGTEVRAKVENFDILERERPFLQDLPGMVDALHLDGERYSVLVVRHGEEGPVTIQGLMRRPELNGQRGRVVRKDAERCTILMDVGASEVSVKKANLVFDVPRTVAQRLFLRPQHVEEFRGLPEKPGAEVWDEDKIDEERDERLIGERLEQCRRARGEL